MSSESPLIMSLRTAVDAAPADVPLRLHLAELLLDEGQAEDAVAQAAVALQHVPGDEAARELMMRAMGLPRQASAPQAPAEDVAASESPAPADGFDWRSAEDEIKDVVPPRFVSVPPAQAPPPGATPRR